MRVLGHVPKIRYQMQYVDNIAPTKNESILSIVGMLLLVIAKIGGFFTLGQPAFFNFSLIALAGLSIQIGVYLKRRKIMKKQQSI